MVFSTEQISEAATRAVLYGKVFLQISQNSPKLCFNKVVGLRSATLLKKETLAQVFSCEFYEISKNTFFTEHLWTTASQICLRRQPASNHKKITLFMYYVDKQAEKIFKSHSFAASLSDFHILAICILAAPSKKIPLNVLRYQNQ